MKKILLLGLCIIFLISVTAYSISKEIDLEPEQKTALSNIGIDDIIIKHNCETEKDNCKALLYKQTSEEVYDNETGNYTTVYTTVLNKEIKIDISEQFCIKEELNKTLNETICIDYRGLNQNELDEKIRIIAEDKLRWIASVLIKRNNAQEDLLNNEMEITIT